ncbi:hypothetical protein BDA99DRAFT_555080 [Phascolomyces articulosus]|uniref:F-box domain-containing protein n=1 Tax=Phascolomyces articulosus TaxID=60185 RepID=A0AAD5KB40_9FUNG|nr:hypothetical protein BDA99DRAFT_555080 [Phascolomyces articulosus]
MSTTKTTLQELPPEILWNIVSYFSLEQLSNARLVSLKLRHFCDHPDHWKHVRLVPPQIEQQNGSLSSSSSSSISLWQMNDLERILAPHLKLIQSVQIWGVRDNIVRYLLQNCVNLYDLTLCGWTTLSNHAFKIPASSTTGTSKLALRRLELIGTDQQPNYAAIDARLLGDLLTQCPDLSELMLGCQVHIHAQTLLKELKKRRTSNSKSSQPPMLPPIQLRSLTLATRRTWSQRHVAELLDLCPQLERVCLFLAAAKGFDLKKQKDARQEVHQLMMSNNNKPQEVSLEPSSDGEEDDYDNNVDMATDMIILRSSSPLS